MLMVFSAETPIGVAQQIDYERDIQPLLAEKCAACHGALRQESGLRLDHGELIRQGGDSGSIIESDDATGSILIERVSTNDISMRMPPENEGQPLSSEQIAALVAWLKAGALSPADEPMPVDPAEHWAWDVPRRVELPRLESSDASPGEEATDWSHNPIDAFIYAKLRDHQLSPVEIAEPRIRLRRLYFDLTGLPPSPDAQRRFEADPSPEAWARTVDALLEDPAHGERWARHWMDVWRYSDWDGYKDQIRGSQRHIWRWRDWIVESLNADKGYDQMVVEMLAGDEFAPSDPDTVRATGFLARNFHHSNRNIWLDATVEHTAKAFLGMTINCARCHDHKYDPISQKEYYAFRAIFEPHQVRTERLEGQPDVAKDGLARVFDGQPDAPTYLYVGGNEKHPDKEHPLAPATPEIIDLGFEVAPVALPPEAVFPAIREFVKREDLSAANQRLAKAQAEWNKLSEQSDAPNFELRVARQGVLAAEASLRSLEARWAADTARYRNVSSGGLSEGSVEFEAVKSEALSAEHLAGIEQAKLQLLNAQQALAEAEKAHSENSALGRDTAASESPDAEKKPAESEKETLAAVAAARKAVDEAQQKLEDAEKPRETSDYSSVGTAYPSSSTGRRLALGRWITHPENPLTARVAVNYLWMHHFGEPLVENVFDFGLRSAEPQHRALLDWLAVELIDHGWSMKHMHRLIATSRAYQLASYSADEELLANNRALDPDNRLLWRANVQRLDAEVIRDSLLQVAGNLDKTLGGPDIDYADGEKVWRRSLYFRHAYEKQMTMLVIFDAAGPTECYRRSESIIPQQALALANSPLAFDQARHLAAKLWSAGSPNGVGSTQPVQGGTLAGTGSQSEETILRDAFEILLGRPCTPEELSACEQFLRQQSTLLSNPENLTQLPGMSSGQTQAAKDAKQRARENLVHALMNHNDFVTVR